MGRLRLCVALATALSLLMPTAAQAATVIKAASASTSFGYKWSPHKVSVSKGARVVWRHPTSATHDVTSYGGGWKKSAIIAPGVTTSFTFDNAGTYKFRCKLHSTLTNGVCSGMCGKVVVG